MGKRPKRAELTCDALSLGFVSSHPFGIRFDHVAPPTLSLVLCGTHLTNIQVEKLLVWLFDSSLFNGRRMSRRGDVGHRP
jgi:hypothetical protein